MSLRAYNSCSCLWCTTSGPTICPLFDQVTVTVHGPPTSRRYTRCGWALTHYLSKCAPGHCHSSIPHHQNPLCHGHVQALGPNHKQYEQFSSAIPWRKAGVRYNNGVYFDAVETLDAVVNNSVPDPVAVSHRPHCYQRRDW